MSCNDACSVGILLKHGANIDTVDHQGETPLARSAKNGLCDVKNAFLIYEANCLPCLDVKSFEAQKRALDKKEYELQAREKLVEGKEMDLQKIAISTANSMDRQLRQINVEIQSSLASVNELVNTNKLLHREQTQYCVQVQKEYAQFQQQAQLQRRQNHVKMFIFMLLIPMLFSLLILISYVFDLFMTF